MPIQEYLVPIYLHIEAPDEETARQDVRTIFSRSRDVPWVEFEFGEVEPS